MIIEQALMILKKFSTQKANIYAIFKPDDRVKYCAALIYFVYMKEQGSNAFIVQVIEDEPLPHIRTNEELINTLELAMSNIENRGIDVYICKIRDYPDGGYDRCYYELIDIYVPGNYFILVANDEISFSDEIMYPPDFS